MEVPAFTITAGASTNSYVVANGSPIPQSWAGQYIGELGYPIFYYPFLYTIDNSPTIQQGIVQINMGNGAFQLQNATGGTISGTVFTTYQITAVWIGLP